VLSCLKRIFPSQIRAPIALPFSNGLSKTKSLPAFRPFPFQETPHLSLRRSTHQPPTACSVFLLCSERANMSCLLSGALLQILKDGATRIEDETSLDLERVLTTSPAMDHSLLPSHPFSSIDRPRLEVAIDDPT